MPFDSLTLDAKRETEKERQRFARSKLAEGQYARQLQMVARQIDALVRGLQPDDEAGLAVLNATLRRYADVLRPWARSAARIMLENVLRKDLRNWRQQTRQFSAALRQEIETAPTGAALRQLMDQQVDLITSLPIEASRRVHRLAYESMVDSTRADTLKEDIMRTGAVTESRAKLIAFTEVGRATSTLTMVRAQHLGATHFVWETARDYKVRKRHRALQGKVFRWDDLPVTGENGERSLPGAIYNCRCFARPVLEI
jgi:SPP1 gp7 family putative phage head morphogenesis protein